MKQYRYLDLIMCGFVTVLLISNILSSAKIIDLGVTLAGIPLIFDAGTLVFPISYIFGDILTEVYGYQRSRRVIWAGFAASLLLAFFVGITSVLPGETLWEQTASQSAYAAILGGISGLIVASMLGYLVGEFANSFVLARMKVMTRGRWMWSRTIGSTLIGQILDTAVFFSVATALGVFPSELFFSLVITNYIFKVAIEVIFTPITLMVVQWLKKAEQEDIYDTGIDFNPFRLTIHSDTHSE